MKLIHLLTLLIFFLSSNLHAQPRCDLFYDDVYSSKTYPTDEDLLTVKDEVSIGIELLSKWNKEIEEWERKDADTFDKVTLYRGLGLPIKAIETYQELK